MGNHSNAFVWYYHSCRHVWISISYSSVQNTHELFRKTTSGVRQLQRNIISATFSSECSPGQGTGKNYKVTVYPPEICSFIRDFHIKTSGQIFFCSYRPSFLPLQWTSLHGYYGFICIMTGIFNFNNREYCYSTRTS